MKSGSGLFRPWLPPRYAWNVFANFAPHTISAKNAVQGNGPEYLLKLHSLDGIIERLGRPRYTPDRSFGTQLRVDIHSHGADHERRCSSPHGDGVALFVGSHSPCFGCSDKAAPLAAA